MFAYSINIIVFLQKEYYEMSNYSIKVIIFSSSFNFIELSYELMLAFNTNLEKPPPPSPPKKLLH